MISLIWATDKNYLIGNKNELPWHYKEDLLYFKKITLNKTVLMGYNTFQSILDIHHKPLPNRKNLVASLADFKYDGVEVINNLHDFLSKNHEEEIFVMGGKTIYEIAFPYADRLYITFIDDEHEGNIFYRFSLANFKLISSEIKGKLSFNVYERIK